MSYEEILNKLTNREPFSFARFGDGEINAVLGHCNGGTRNCDGHFYFPDMGKRLGEILKSKPEYTIGVQNLLFTTRDNDREFWNLYDWKSCPSADVLHKASMKGRLDLFFEALAERKILFVGNKDFEGFFPDIVEVPAVDCWLEYERILEDVTEKIVQSELDDEGPGNLVILYSCSMPAEILIDDIYRDFPNITQIDTGSLFDPYIGKQTRSYHKNLKLMG